VLPDETLAVLGVTETLTVGVDPAIDTVALAVLVGSAVLVAVTVTLVEVTTLGATNTPLLEIVPALADHVTLPFLLPETDALNCLLPPELRLTLVGEIVMLTEVPECLFTAIEPWTFALLPWASVTCAQKYFVVALQGFPVIAPVLVLNDMQAGRLPSISANLYGELPPAAMKPPI